MFALQTAHKLTERAYVRAICSIQTINVHAQRDLLELMEHVLILAWDLPTKAVSVSVYNNISMLITQAVQIYAELVNMLLVCAVLLFATTMREIVFL